MSPAIAKTSDQVILDAARGLIRQHGAGALVLHDLAEMVGIRTPSLYKRFAHKAALLRAVKDDALVDLRETLVTAVAGLAPEAALIAMASAYRAFALREPHLYQLIQRADLKEQGLEAERQAVAPVLHLMTALVGADDALSAARFVTSFLHGFVSMEIEGNFRLGGSVEAAFQFALDAVLAGLRSRRPL